MMCEQLTKAHAIVVRREIQRHDCTTPNTHDQRQMKQILNLKLDEIQQEIEPNVFQLNLWQDPPWLSILPFQYFNSFDGACDYCQYLTGISCQAAGQISIVPFSEATCRM